MMVGRKRENKIDDSTFDEAVKSRHPGENRGPDIFNYLIMLDSGFRRNDLKSIVRFFTSSSTFKGNRYAVCHAPCTLCQAF